MDEVAKINEGEVKIEGKAKDQEIQKQDDGIEGLTPEEVVESLDTYIIGQQKAKRLVAVALRNRYRRLRLPDEMQDEVAPKNILMIGATGVGKTEIARRLAKLCGAPFVKVEATKYTEVGYVGRDCESMVKDLMSVGFNMVKAREQDRLRGKCVPRVEEGLLDLLLPGSSGTISVKDDDDDDDDDDEAKSKKSTREKLRELLRAGKLEDRTVEITQRPRPGPSGGMMEIFAGGNLEDFERTMQNITSIFTGGNASKRRQVTVAEARNILMAENLERAVDIDKVAQEAKRKVEQSGIIFIDEIDKIAVKDGDRDNVARDGVQRDILPIVEGSNVNTKWGVVDTSHILFIAAGAFSLSRPSDLIPELQGRFPLRVELDSLHKDEFRRILTEPKNALIRQYEALLLTEGVTLHFSDDAIDRISYLAEDVNNRSENIGARRLHTMMEAVLEDISFNADKHKGETIQIDAKYVDKKLKDVVEDQDLSRYIL